MSPTKSVYQKVVHISAEYLGPAAERFMRRQITTHLDKKPEDLTYQDIDELTNWVKITFALLTEDHRIVEAFTRDLQSVANSRPMASKRRRLD